MSWGISRRPRVSNLLSSPNPREGSDGDIQLRQTPFGAKMFGKLGGAWYSTPLSIKEGEFTLKTRNGSDSIKLDAATGLSIGNWKINKTSIFSGTEDHSGYTANAGDMTLYSDGSDSSIHAKEFYISSAGILNCTSAVIAGTVAAGSGSSYTGNVIAAGKVDATKVFQQDGIPTSTSIGDVWFDTNDDNHPYTAEAIGADQITGGEWVSMRDATISGALNTANAKNTTFYQDDAPSATKVGDLWFDTNDDQKMYRATATGTGDWSQAVANAGNITAGTIDTNRLNASEIQAATVTVGAVNALAITADSIDLTNATVTGTLAAARIAAGSLDADKITGGTISITQLATIANIDLSGKIILASAGTQNVCIGTGNADAGENNISIGVNAGAALTTNGDENVAIGTSALLTNASTAFAVAIGFEALKVSVGQGGINNNVAIGYKAGVKINDGLANTIIGAAAGDEMTGADFNVVLGQNAAADLTTGNNNVVLGYLADVSTGAASGQIAIGYSVACTGNNDMTVGAGTNTASLDLNGSDTSWAAASSDERFKENITTSVAGLSFINDLRPVTYNWKKKKDAPSGTIYYEEGSDEPCLGHSYGNTLHGFIAQEVKAAIDNHSELKEGFKMWRQYDNGVQTVADGNLIPILTKAVQELSAKIDTMQTEINTLKEG
tara:strand:- start:44 stop:2050 length:2007 start_codon:yes stop_codon:yes gene_type:complete